MNWQFYMSVSAKLPNSVANAPNQPECGETPTNSSLRCRHTRAWRFTIHNSPLTSLLQVLCIHLKRFRFTSCVRMKLSLPIGFPLSGLDMGQFTVAGGRRGGGGGGGGGETNSVYDLAAVVVHHGSGWAVNHTFVRLFRLAESVAIYTGIQLKHSFPKNERSQWQMLLFLLLYRMGGIDYIHVILYSMWGGGGVRLDLQREEGGRSATEGEVE